MYTSCLVTDGLAGRPSERALSYASHVHNSYAWSLPCTTRRSSRQPREIGFVISAPISQMDPRRNWGFTQGPWHGDSWPVCGPRSVPPRAQRSRLEAECPAGPRAQPCEPGGHKPPPHVPPKAAVNPPRHLQGLSRAALGGAPGRGLRGGGSPWASRGALRRHL